MLAGAPLLTFHPCDGRSPTKRALLDFLSKNLPRRQISDDVTFVESLPRTATSKPLKTELRHCFDGVSAASSLSDWVFRWRVGSRFLTRRDGGMALREFELRP
jgi:hypothetical protein